MFKKIYIQMYKRDLNKQLLLHFDQNMDLAAQLW